MAISFYNSRTQTHSLRIIKQVGIRDRFLFMICRQYRSYLANRSIYLKNFTEDEGVRVILIQNNSSFIHAGC